MKKFGLFFSILIIASQICFGQFFSENFEYLPGQLTNLNGGANVSGGNWVNFDGTALPLQVTSGNLTYLNYPSSGIGNKVNVINGTAEDAYRQFVTQGIGSKTYASFLMNVTSTTGLLPNSNENGDFTVSFMSSTSTGVFYARVSLRVGSVTNTFNIGLRTTSSNTTTWLITDYPINSSLLVVVNYEIVSGNTNDIANLWVNPALDANEPTPDLTQTSALSNDPDEVARITIRQGGNSFRGQLDGFRVSNFWSLSPLPVELTSFSAAAIGSIVKLSWNTATEVNNYGFEVERASLSASPLRIWEKIGFVNGYGNSNSPKSYSYEDKDVIAGKYSYRLKQIDNDGQFEYSKTIEVYLGAPKKFELSQNYPNPFNPVTTIKFNLRKAGNVKLKLFNILGQELKTLVNEFKEPGVHTINFDASDLNSGMYIYKLEAGSFVQTRKMTLFK